MLSYKPRTALSDITSAVEELNTRHTPGSVHELVEQLRKTVPELFERVRKAASAATASYRAYYNKSRSMVEFEAGTWVFVEYPKGEGHSAMSSPWRGPWEVKARLKEQVYSVYDPHSDATHRVHVRRMRPVDTSRLSEWRRFWAERSKNKTGYDYPITEILDVRGGPGLGKGEADARFRVRWEGYELDDYDEWLPYGSIMAPDDMAAFLAKRGLKAHRGRLVQAALLVSSDATRAEGDAGAAAGVATVTATHSTSDTINSTPPHGYGGPPWPTATPVWVRTYDGWERFWR